MYVVYNVCAYIFTYVCLILYLCIIFIEVGNKTLFHLHSSHFDHI